MFVFSLQLQHKEENHNVVRASQTLWANLEGNIPDKIKLYLAAWIKTSPVLIGWFMKNQHQLNDTALHLLRTIDR